MSKSWVYPEQVLSVNAVLNTSFRFWGVSQKPQTRFKPSNNDKPKTYENWSIDRGNFSISIVLISGLTRQSNLFKPQWSERTTCCLGLLFFSHRWSCTVEFKRLFDVDSIFTMLGTTVITPLIRQFISFNTCSGILFTPCNMFKRSIHGFIIIGCWHICNSGAQFGGHFSMK